MKEKGNNKGFTLVELIIATAILGIVVVGIFGFMQTGANSYRSVSSGIRLQTAAQQAMSQVQETVLDCDTAMYISTAGDAMYLLSRDDDTDDYTLSAYQMGSDDLEYRQLSVTSATDESSIEASEAHMLSEDVSAFSADAGETENGRVTGVGITLTLERDGKSYTGKQTIALRNTPQLANSVEELLDQAS